LASVGVPVAFARIGRYALNDQETINLNQGGIGKFPGVDRGHAAKLSSGAGSLILLATGMFGLIGGRRMFRPNA